MIPIPPQLQFAERLVAWQKQHGRHHLPWQTGIPYHVWLSEIMLQQTQVATVLDYYPRFLASFPTVHALAAAPQDAVLQLWAGLGYYSRARNLHNAAQQIVNQYGGQFPAQRIELEKLSGVGRSTAAAIAAFAFQQRETILDGNVKRVLCRLFALEGNPSDKSFERQLWSLAENLLPSHPHDMPAYTQGLMDLGATVCKRSKPLCAACPVHDSCQAKAQNRITELPQKKAATAVSLLPMYWLLLRNADGDILLHKRPQTGIWAGLYCLPSFETLAQLYEAANSLGIPPDTLQESPSIEHRLTHRLLEIMPYTVDSPLSAHHTLQQFPQAQWIEPAKLPDYGLPKPLQTYLNTFSC